MYIISACLAGRNCRYNAKTTEIGWVKDLIRNKKCILVCPEDEGNLPTPRPPAERVGDRIIDKQGNDITEAFFIGAQKALEKSMISSRIGRQEIDIAILKSNSPSCGCGCIYDGTFSGKLIQGDGVFAAMIKEQGIRVISENDEDEINKLKAK